MIVKLEKKNVHIGKWNKTGSQQTNVTQKGDVKLDFTFFLKLNVSS